MVGVLYGDKSKLSDQLVMECLKQNGIEAERIRMDRSVNLMDYSLIINLMGKDYEEELAAGLVDYFQNGGRILHLGQAPFTRNICTEERTNHRVLRDFHVVDDFLPIESGTFLVQNMVNHTEIRTELTGLQSAVYHLCESGKRDAYLEHIVDAYDSAGEFKAAVVIRIVTFRGGSQTFFQLDLSDEMFTQPFWKETFLLAVRKELSGSVLLDVISRYARYIPGEEAGLAIHCENVNAAIGNALQLSVQVTDEAQQIVFAHEEKMELPYQKELTFPALEASLYTVKAKVCAGDQILRELTTGFMVIGEEEIRKEMDGFAPLYIDKEVSSDYCLCKGEIAPILGTTYFVSDVYRECFVRLNTALCEQELKKLAKDGFQVIRSGYWKHNEDLYHTEGSISELGIRALQAFFLLAERHGFTVQFALGNVLLNQWDVTASPIHNPDMRKKCMNLIKSFAQNFGNYKNVSLDIVNEPSYSVKGAWTIGRPSYEPGELDSFRKWLIHKYGEISNLREAWGETASSLRSFEEIQMPPEDLFSRLYFRTEQRKNHTWLTDFFCFARHEFLDWVREIRDIVRQCAPDMIVTMGRDETLRIPAQQDEVLAGNVDMVCWHQWGFDGAMHTEYLLNRVQGKVCVAQEQGVYPFDDICSGKRFDEYERMTKMERKLLCAHGNFIQWQAFHDPYLYELSENALGLYRADLSPSPSRDMVKEMIRCEKSASKYMGKRKDEKVKILTLYGTSYYFSVDSALAQSGLRNHINVLYNELHEQTNLVLEHLFDPENADMVGNPSLIILPGMQMLSKQTWGRLLAYMEEGGTVLIDGVVDQNEFFKPEERVSRLDPAYQVEKLLSIETLCIDGTDYSLDFRPTLGYADPGNALNCGNSRTIREYPVEKGKLIYCPYPVELSANREAVAALYRYAIRSAGAENGIYREIKCNPNVLFLATAYEKCTVYTLINYGREDRVDWTDNRSGERYRLHLPESRGCKVWIAPDGEMLQKYGDCEISRM